MCWARDSSETDEVLERREWFVPRLEVPGVERDASKLVCRGAAGSFPAPLSLKKGTAPGKGIKRFGTLTLAWTPPALGGVVDEEPSSRMRGMKPDCCIPAETALIASGKVGR